MNFFELTCVVQEIYAIKKCILTQIVIRQDFIDLWSSFGLISTTNIPTSQKHPGTHSNVDLGKWSKVISQLKAEEVNFSRFL